MKQYWILEKRHLLMIVSVLLTVVLLIIFCIPPAAEPAQAVAAKNRLLPIYSVQKQEKVISISFDAAWGNEDTEILIDILKKYNVKATFFLVGDWVDKYPESVKALYDAGHEIANHSATHPDLSNLSREQVVEQVKACNEKIKAVTGTSPLLLRPPYGAYNNTVIEAVSSLGMYTIQWDVDSLDWKDLSAQKIYDRVVSKTKPGSIVLFHNAAKHTPEALPMILEKLIADGYQFAKISDLIIKKDYTIDHAGKQIANKRVVSQ
ncbi:MAG: polysaccharide deacetylase family protein [Clostridia bacterium]|nr:polysaccharide deacetylase family protein [Clostridia bacterium]